MISTRRSVVVVSTAAVLAGLGGGALGFAIHSAEASPAPAPITVPAHQVSPAVINTPVHPVTPVVPNTPVHPVTPVTPVTPVHPVTPVKPFHPVLPNYAGTVNMTITNNTHDTLELNGSDNPYGDWIVSPQSELAPGASETVSASTWNQNGFGVDVTYGDSDGSSVVFMANNYAGHADTSGTRVDGSNPGHWVIQSVVNQGAPNMTATYTLMPGLLTPPVQPVTPDIQPVDPAIQPDNPVIQPDNPVVQPVNPVVQPDNPVVQPVNPSTSDSSTATVSNVTSSTTSDQGASVMSAG